MQDPMGLVHVVDYVPELDDARDSLVLVHALDGFLDAGSAGRLAADQLAVGSRVVASFDVDQLYDYRGRRPPLTFSENHYQDYAAPRLVLRLAEDDNGTPYLLLTGPEPDYQWERFAEAVRGLLTRFGVTLAVGLGAVPMALPHTRPLMLTVHSAQPERLETPNLWKGNIRVPGSAAALLELRLGEWGHGAMGFVAHVPHYVAQHDYPQAAVDLIEAVARQTGLELSTGALVEAAAERAAEIAAQVEGSDEIREAVTALEQQYDAFTRASESSLLADDTPLPSAEELGAEFERFLAGLDRRDE
ncbi:MAG TPA: PAC2 family protein [Nocardioidaceae bacterium]|nr:PAC2 family protein [Nocardioidaceae bacterium]